MGVSNLTFIYLFLPITIFAYYLVSSITAKNNVLILFSIIFYAFGEFVWLPLLLLFSLLDYFSGKYLYNSNNPDTKKYFFMLSVLLRILILVGLKYWIAFFIKSNDTFSLWFHLPLGISFYFFRSISYLTELYFERIEYCKKYSEYLLYLAFFPVIIAGPIVRYSEIHEQFKERKVYPSRLSEGIVRFCLGLFKKLLLADSLESLAKQFLSINEGSSYISVLFGLFLFSLQIYYDFSGYTDIVLGIGSMFGFVLPENFDYPYKSKSVAEFWRRWHITLGGFFRDFVFIPLSLTGKKGGMVFNLLVVWLLTGLWHGFTLNFIIWGLYFGLLLICEVYFLQKLLKRIPGILQNIYLLVVVGIGWSFFYYTNYNALTEFYKVIFTFQKGSLLNDITLKQSLYSYTPIIIISIALCFPMKSSWKQFLKNALTENPKIKFALQIAVTATILLLCTSLLVDKSYNAFMYGGF